MPHHSGAYGGDGSRAYPGYAIALLVALAAFLPMLWGAFPEITLWVPIGMGLLLAAVAGNVEHRKNAASTWR